MKSVSDVGNFCRESAIRGIGIAKLACGYARMILAENGLPITANDRKLQSLKNKHIGRRCFVIGNGPSLKIGDLDRLKNEITFACNKIYMAFDQTEWRPTYYTAIDRLVLENNCKSISQLKLTKLLPKWAARKVIPDDGTVFYGEIPLNMARTGFRPYFSRNSLVGIAGGHTVLYDNLQLAFYMGIREVYLIGADHTWNLPDVYAEHSEYKEVLVSQGEINHFHPQYHTPGEKWAIPRPDLQEGSFKMARVLYERYGGVIYNATRGGKLEVFPRADFDRVIAHAVPLTISEKEIEE